MIVGQGDSSSRHGPWATSSGGSRRDVILQPCTEMAHTPSGWHDADGVREEDASGTLAGRTTVPASNLSVAE
jgi:hypothetical protein